MSALLEEVEAARRLPPPAMRKAIREAAGVSQGRLAEALNVHRVTIARWEAGTRKPRPRQLVAYVRLLDSLAGRS